MRDVIGKTKHKNKKALASDLKLIYQQDTKEQAVIQARDFCRKWYLSEPKAVASLKHHLLLTLTYLQFDASLWKQIRTNNILEREFRELRRRIKVMDSSFNDTQSATRYAGSLINYMNQNYPASRRTLHTNP